MNKENIRLENKKFRELIDKIKAERLAFVIKPKENVFYCNLDIGMKIVDCPYSVDNIDILIFINRDKFKELDTNDVVILKKFKFTKLVKGKYGKYIAYINATELEIITNDDIQENNDNMLESYLKSSLKYEFRVNKESGIIHRKYMNKFEKIVYKEFIYKLFTDEPSLDCLLRDDYIFKHLIKKTNNLKIKSFLNTMSHILEVAGIYAEEDHFDNDGEYGYYTIKFYNRIENIVMNLYVPEVDYLDIEDEVYMESLIDIILDHNIKEIRYIINVVRNKIIEKKKPFRIFNNGIYLSELISFKESLEEVDSIPLDI